MRKLGIFIFALSTLFVGVIGGRSTIHASADANKQEKIVYVGGMSAGFTLKTEGAQVIGTCEVTTDDGTCRPARDAGVRANDTIMKVNNIKIESITQLNEIINKSKGNPLHFEILRKNNLINLEITPQKEAQTDRYKIGVLIRDFVSGIGTVTYIDRENGRFGALGHAVMAENRKEMQISDGNVYACSIIGVNKGVRGRAGELRGAFLNDKPLGKAEKLCDCGIFGEISVDFKTDELMSVVASSNGASPGNACIYTTIDGVSPKKYDIEIVKVDKSNKENKNYVIKIKDEALIDETGGIVQGMSGSPILQNGKMIGAVTHVFLNDPTRGYGIDVETMLRE
ncbi:MAG: SpoIVB peptidase [Clostridiales bacterium]|nr:SpoIVB peptidase [Clostridiales bacterium]